MRGGEPVMNFQGAVTVERNWLSTWVEVFLLQ